MMSGIYIQTKRIFPCILRTRQIYFMKMRQPEVEKMIEMLILVVLTTQLDHQNIANMHMCPRKRNVCR